MSTPDRGKKVFSQEKLTISRKNRHGIWFARISILGICFFMGILFRLKSGTSNQEYSSYRKLKLSLTDIDSNNVREFSKYEHSKTFQHVQKPKPKKTRKWKGSSFMENYMDPEDCNSFLRKPKSSQVRFCNPLVKVIIVVTSAAENFEERKSIRETWGTVENTYLLGAPIAFFVDFSQSSQIQKRIALEAQEHNDIVQENLHIKTRFSSTLKSIAMLKWIHCICLDNSPHLNVSLEPKFILKADDDMFVNIRRLLNVAEENSNEEMIGSLECGVKEAVDSILNNPHNVSNGVYPGHLAGTAYLIPTSVVPNLLRNSVKIPLISSEEIFVTGIVRKESNIRVKDSPFFASYDASDPPDFCNFTTMVSYHELLPKEMRYIWANRRIPSGIESNNKDKKCIRNIPEMNEERRKLCFHS